MNDTLFCTQAYANTRAHVYVGVCVSVYACVRLCVCVCVRVYLRGRRAKPNRP